MNCPKNGLDNNAIRGCTIGCLISIVLWAAILFMAYHVWGCCK